MAPNHSSFRTSSSATGRMWFSSCWIITAKRSFRNAESNEAVQISYVTGDDVSIFCHGDIRSDDAKLVANGGVDAFFCDEACQ